jgi:nucleoid-associated protein YejK
MIIIDGVTYDVPIISLDETCDFLDKYAERTVDGKLQRELIGCYFNQQIQFGADATVAQLTALWEKLTEATEFHTVTVPDEDGVNFTFTAYFSSVKRSLRKYTATKTSWKNLTVHFIAQSPANTPT